MAELLLVSNPKRRRRRKKSARSRRRKGRIPPGLKRYMDAKKAGKAPRRRRRRHAKAAAPVRRRRRRSRGGGVRRPAVGYTVGTKRIRRRKLNPHRRRHFRRRHNPSLRGLTSAIMPTFKAGAWGASGALTLDALWGALYPRVASSLPSVAGLVSNPYLGFLIKGVAAVGAGWVGGKVFKGRGRQMAEGAATVVIHDFAKGLLQQMMPSVFAAGGALPLSGFGLYLSGSAPILGSTTVPQTYLPFNGMGQYMSGASGVSDDHGNWDGDSMGMDPWADQSGNYGS